MHVEGTKDRSTKSYTNVHIICNVNYICVTAWIHNIILLCSHAFIKLYMVNIILHTRYNIISTHKITRTSELVNAAAMSLVLPLQLSQNATLILIK